jgi:hypothetical protein
MSGGNLSIHLLPHVTLSVHYPSMDTINKPTEQEYKRKLVCLKEGTQRRSSW